MSETEKKKPSQQSRDALRLKAAQEALRLFEVQGFENTSVDEIAQSSGVSRRTLFRQFGSKEDIIFADHEMLLEEIQEFLDSQTTSPWRAVIESAKRVFDHFYEQQEFAQHRYRVIRTVPVLRAREIVTVFRYEQLYSEYLRKLLPESEHLKAIMFSSSITSSHNYILRKMLRDGGKTGHAQLNDTLVTVANTFEIDNEHQLDPQLHDRSNHGVIFAQLHGLLDQLEKAEK